MKVNRRELFEERRVRSGAALAWRVVASSKKLFAQDVLLNLLIWPSPANSGIEHIVVVTMENRVRPFSGMAAECGGKQQVDVRGQRRREPRDSIRSPVINTGCPHPDPDHSYDGARVEYDNGSDGRLSARGQQRCLIPIGLRRNTNPLLRGPCPELYRLRPITSLRSLARHSRTGCSARRRKPTRLDP